MDSLLASAGLVRGVEMSGDALIDVNQYRVRGRFHLSVAQGGNTVLEFTSTSPMGGRREDVVFSWWADTLRVFDRENGVLHEGDRVDSLVSEGAGFAVDMASLIRRAIASPMGCAGVTRLAVSESGEDAAGVIDGARFSVSTDGGRVARSDWPAPFFGDGGGERLEVEYRWAENRLDRITLYAPQNRWRIRLSRD